MHKLLTYILVAELLKGNIPIEYAVAIERLLYQAISGFGKVSKHRVDRRNIKEA